MNRDEFLLKQRRKFVKEYILEGQKQGRRICELVEKLAYEILYLSEKTIYRDWYS